MSTRRKLSLRIGHGRVRGDVIAELTKDERLEFTLPGSTLRVSLPLTDLFWRAMQADAAAVKSGRVPKPRPLGPAIVARRYDISRADARLALREGAPVDDPDRMGEFLGRLREFSKAGRSVRR